MDSLPVNLVIATAAFAIAFVARRRIQRRRKNRCWVRPWLQRREEENRDAYSMAMLELMPEDPNEFRNYFRMNAACFNKLLSLIQGRLQRQNTVMRESISPSRRLAVTLRFLATGESYKSLAFAHRISVPSISKIVVEVCEAICCSMRDIYLKAPDTATKWLQIAREFDELWQFPNCIGAMDGKHIAFSPPRSAGSVYYNYKKFHSIVLLAVVDARYRFTLTDIGCNGRVSDGGVFANSKISEALKHNTLNVPGEKLLQDSDISVPHVIIADDAFRLLPYVMKPYRECETIKEKVFNYRASRTRRTAENAFGILANRFRILLGIIRLSVDKVELIVETLCILHNFLIDEASSTYLANIDNEDTEHCRLEEGLWRADPTLEGIPFQRGNRTSLCARDVRNKFCKYFNSTGFVPWQWESVKRYNY